MARYSPHAAPAPLSERVLLSLYDWRDPDERAAIKRCGAKWDPVLRAWWINYWDAVENPGIHRWVTDPMLADVLREANDFNNYGAAPPEKKKGKPRRPERPEKTRKAPQKARMQRPKGSLMVSA